VAYTPRDAYVAANEEGADGDADTSEETTSGMADVDGAATGA
jgi:hypothetical protein